MRLLEVGSNHRRNIKKLADSVVRAWEKDDINRYELAWLTQLSSDERLLAKLYKGSQKYEIYGGDGNEPLLDSAATYASAYSILMDVIKMQG